MLPCPVIKINDKLQLNPGRMAKGMGPSGIKMWVTSPGKELRCAEVHAEGRENTEWLVEEGGWL